MGTSLSLLPSVVTSLRTAKVLVTDFDGVHTDNSAWITEEGIEVVKISRSDGMGVAALARLGIKTLIISSEENAVVSARARKLKIPALQGVDDKVGALLGWLGEYGISISDVVFIGNDINDVPLLSAVGLSVGVRDSHRAARKMQTMCLRSPGGSGAVRELADLIIDSRVRLSVADRVLWSFRVLAALLR